jgi:hypothetical protein
MSRLARGAFLFCFACCALLLAQGPARAEMDYIYGYIGRADDHDNYVYALLDEALARTQGKWGDYGLRTVPEVPRNRQIRELETGKGSTITMAVLGTAHDVGKHLRPVAIPVDKGLVGYRALLIRRSDQARFAAVRSAEDLKPFAFGQNFIWDDVDILKANGLTVQVGDDFEGLFQMLTRGRFDALPRGLGEISREFSERSELYPDMQIEKTLLIHYPLPIYFWFSRNPAGEKMAQRLEEGLWSMIDDGTFDRIFWKYNRAILQGLDLAHRRVIQLDNPFLPADTPLADTRLWLSPEQLGMGISSR